MVSPYRILHGANGAAMPEEAWAMDGRFGSHPSNEPLIFIAYHPEHGELTFEGTWVICGTTVFSMYCGAAIPILAFIRHVRDEMTATGFREENGFPSDWLHLCNGENLLPVVEGTRSDIRRWTQHWNPIYWGQRPTQLGDVSPQTSGFHLSVQGREAASVQAFRDSGAGGPSGGSPVPPR